MFTKIAQQLSSPGSELAVTGLRGAAHSWLISMLAQTRPVCCIVSDEHQLPILEQDVDLFTSRPSLLYPSHEIPPYTPLSPDQRICAGRLSTLYRLLKSKETAPAGNTTHPLVICSIEALLRRVMPVDSLAGEAEYLLPGVDYDREDLLARLQKLGYEQVSLVQSYGDYSVRGGVIDIYPPPFPLEDGSCHDGPIRLDFFGDVVESLRSFDPFSQRSSGELDEATLLPVSEIMINSGNTAACKAITEQLHIFGEKYGWSSDETARLTERTSQGMRFAGMEFFLPLYYPYEKNKEQQATSARCPSPLDFLPENTLLIFLEPESINQALNLINERIDQNYMAARTSGAPALPPDDIFTLKEELATSFSRFSRLLITDFPEEGLTTQSVVSANHQLLKQEVNLRRTKQGLLGPLSEQIRTWQRNDQQVFLCCRSSRHTANLAELLSRHEHLVEPTDLPLLLDGKDADPSRLYLVNHPLSSGFSLPDQGYHLLSESELFGEMRLGTKSKKRTRGEPVRFSELHDGDIVVHRDHGLGFFRGLTTIELQGIVNDFMLIEYRDEDKLYLPVDRLNLITKYQGLSDREPKLDKLGSQAWKSTKAKVKDEVWKVAQELLEIYARRELREGRTFSQPGEMFRELEESFPYDETPGQQQSINDVLQDLTSDKPMDRLICGDVGYGKTEVAVRAAFKVVEDGYQVAILVPTTVLAEQHAKTFAERLQGFPISVACLNRFRTTAQQRAMVKELKSGKLDIIIGTHRLLSKDVAFKNLGLLIIDEEHRFGVAHKEKLKKMRAEVDILTLTATPIPRTLQMSLLNIRDLSVISTPPEHRQPVKTFVARYDELVIKESVSRELRRGGQVFFVHNRVKSIHAMGSLIQKLVPEAKIAVAHGQMGGKELEEIMVSFVTKQINVLVSTTIIESGLDIPSANTIIINRADMLGLAEIYQLRGRVGRSSTQSFAYLLVPSLDSLSKDSRERLRALMDCNELGGGFKLAMSDLQIRGGGNLLGISQSGNIAAIGYDLYLELLQKTVADLKARETSEFDPNRRDDFDPEIKLQLSSYIPERYIPDINQRYLCYRRIAGLAHGEDEEQQELKDEMVDRYGRLPDETETLFRIMGVKKRLFRLRVTKLEQGPGSLVFSFSDDTPLSPEMLLQFLANHPATKKQVAPKFTQDGRLIVRASLDSPEQLFGAIDSVLDELQMLCS